MPDAYGQAQGIIRPIGITHTQLSPKTDLEEDGIIGPSEWNHTHFGGVPLVTKLTDPTASDDVNSGFSVGFTWINTFSKKIFQLVDNTASAAIWKEITGGSGESLILYEEKIAGVGGSASFDFTNIPSTAKHLIIEGVIRGEKAAAFDDLQARINGDTGNNYDAQRHAGNVATSSAAQSLAAAQWPLGQPAAASASAGIFSYFKLVFPYYADTLHRKTGYFNSSEVLAESTGNFVVRQGLLHWRSASAINRITLFFAGGDVAEGSKASLYLVSDSSGLEGFSNFLGYATDTSGDRQITSATLVNIPTTAITVTFQVPSNGKVLVKLFATCGATTTANAFQSWGLLDSSNSIIAGAVGESIAVRQPGSGLENFIGAVKDFYLSGLTPGSSYTVKWAAACSTSGGYIKANTNSPAIMEVWSVLQNPGDTEGTSFPSVPTTGQLFRRTDIRNGMWFKYDGTQWISDQEFIVPVAVNAVAVNAIIGGIGFDVAGLDIWIEKFEGGFAVLGTNNGSNYWRLQLYDNNLGGTAGGNDLIWEDDTSADTSNQLTDHTANINAVLDVSGNPSFIFVVVKQSSPAAIRGFGQVVFRYIAT